MKATARALDILTSKNNLTDDHKISWFNNCIRPSLLVSNAVNYFDFEEKEIELIE